MENLFNVEFFQYDRRGKVVDRRMKKDVTIVFRRCSNSYEITIKARNTQDLFVTKEILLSDSNDERVVSIDLPERRFVLTITADEIAIQSLKDSICDCTGSIEDNTAAITGSANKIRDRVGSINKLQSCGLHLSKSALRSPTATSTSGTSTASVTANCIDSVVSSATNGLSPAAKRVNTKTTPVCLRARDKFHHDDRDSNSRRDNNERKSREGIVKPIKRLNYASKESEDKENRTNTSSQSRSLPNDLLDTLTVQQLEILDQCRNKNNIFYSGGAGTGKSHLLAAIIAEMKLLHGADTVHVTATTGLAACAIGGITIHQFAGISAISEGISDKEIDNMIEKVIMISN